MPFLQFIYIQIFCVTYCDNHSVISHKTISTQTNSSITYWHINSISMVVLSTALAPGNHVKLMFNTKFSHQNSMWNKQTK